MTEVLPPQIERTVIYTNDGRTVLRELIPEEDAAGVSEMATHDKEYFARVRESFAELCATPQAAASWIKGETAADAHFENAKFGIWDQDRLVGCAGYRVINSSRAEIWYVVDPRLPRRGYGSSAADALSQYLFEQGFLVVSADVWNGNEASRGLLKKIGFSVVGRFIPTGDVEYYLRFEKRKPHYTA